MVTALDLIQEQGAGQQALLSLEAQTLLAALTIVTPAPLPPPGGPAVIPGTVQSGGDPLTGLLPFAGTVRVPGLAAGIPFQLTLENIPNPGFVLDLSLGTVEFTLPDVQAGKIVTGADPSEAHVEAVPAAPPVVLQAAAAGLRIDGSRPQEPVALRFFTTGNAAAPLTLTLVPDTILLGTSGFGLQTGPVLFGDLGVDRGLRFTNAALYLPSASPGLGDLRLALQDFTLHLPSGISGTLIVDLPANRGGLHVACTWDNPAARRLSDCAPSSVEIGGTWKLAPLTPAGVGQPLEPARPNGSTNLRLAGRWTFDARTGHSLFSAAVDAPADPRGIVTVTSQPRAATALAAALALGPGIAGAGDRLSLPQLIAAALAVLGGNAALGNLVKGGQVTVERIEVEYGPDLGTAPQITVDYDVTLGFDVQVGGVLSVSTTFDGPMRFRCRGVEISINPTAGGLDAASLSFARSHFEIESAGTWQVGGLANSLLRVANTRSGSGTTWIEVDLDFALDLGVVKVDRATVRAVFDPGSAPRVEFRGLGVSVDLPGVIRGHGQASISGGKLSAALSVTIIPTLIGADAEIVSQNNLFALSVGVLFPGPLPLAATGLGIFGMGGTFGLNAERALPNAGGDPVERELAWFKLPFADQYRPRGGSTVLGLRVLVGTLPDLGFAFSALGGLLVQTGDPTVVVSLNGKFLAPRPENVQSLDIGPALVRLLGILAIGGGGVRLALRGTYEIPHLVRAVVPVSGNFPTGGQPGSYLRIGSDGAGGRAGEPVSVTVLPDIFGLRAWSFLMFEGSRLAQLGGNPAINVDPFAIGYGTGFDYRAYAGPLRLSASAGLLVALGTNPWFLAGEAWLRGEARLGPASLSVGATVTLIISDDTKFASAEVCASVKIFFVRLKGCIHIDIGTKPPTVIPDPAGSPLKTVHFTDRRYRIALHKQQAADTLAEATPTTRVWPDTIPILSFAEWVDAAPVKGAPGPFGKNLLVMAKPQGDGWAGSSELQYQYFLKSLDLVKLDGAGNEVGSITGDAPSAWQLPKAGAEYDPSKPGPSGARDLALLTYDVATWARNLADGGAGLDSDPVGALTNLCDPPRDATPGWAVGYRAGVGAAGLVVVPPEEPSSDPLKSVFFISGPVVTPLAKLPVADGVAAPLEDQLMVALGSGPLLYDPGKVELFPTPLGTPARHFPGVYWLPHFWPAAGGQLDNLPLIFQGTIAPAVTYPVLWLLLWPGDIVRHRTMVSGQLPDGTTINWESGAAVTLPLPAEAAARALIYAQAGVPAAAVPFFPPDPALRWAGLTISYPTDGFTGILGLQGLSVSAVDAAAQAAAAKKAARDAVQKQAKTPDLSPRYLLEPNTRYRIKATMSWEGRRTGAPNRTGTFPEQHFDFHTAPEVLQGVTDPGAIQRVEDHFEPSLLARYVDGFTPTDLTTAWFLDDPLSVHLSVDYVEQLADAYKRVPALHVRRTDAPPPGAGLPLAWEQWVVYTITQATKSEFLLPYDARLVEAQATLAVLHPNCLLPLPSNRTATGTVVLEPRASYELSLQAPLKTTPHALNARVARVLFTTSRYRSPTDLFAKLGFWVGAPAPGDIVVSPVPLLGGGATVGDTALDGVLAALGLDPFPLPTTPRTAVLWQRANDGSWLLRGAVLDAEEPIHRPGRVEVKAVDCNGVPLPNVWSSAAGSRLLWLAAAPFATAGGTLNVTFTNRPIGGAPADVVLSRPLSAQPRFAEEV